MARPNLIPKRKRHEADAFVAGNKPTKAEPEGEKDRQQILIDKGLRHHVAVVARELRTTISQMAEDALRDYMAKVKRPYISG